MWTTNKTRYAAWSPYQGSTEYDNFHPGIDRGDAEGSPVIAMEAGVVYFAGLNPDGISGLQVGVEIRPGTRYSGNHFQRVLVDVGDQVTKGQLIAKMGKTGYATGPHVHEGVSIVQDDGHGIRRTFQYDPELFLQGGALQHSDLIEPLVQFCKVESGSVIWYAGQGYDEGADVFAYARRATAERPAGIYRRGDRLASLQFRFKFVRWRSTHIGRVAIVVGFKERLALREQDMQFT